ncbi:Hypothetical predicted protein [Paramuricea clavata]|uniref:Uncharacterized protein n=1 Tax=Paramuricea clavata TaxID=317549 RepID=A0A6S7IR72_PARCT|nr:Hypothetical predicted protein [Paramuricea clavata]
MNAFHVRKIEKRTYVRRVKVVKSNHGHYETNDNMKIHLQMGDDDMPSAITEATPRLNEFIAVLNKGREFGPCFSELAVSESRSFEEQTSTERRMGTGTSQQSEQGDTVSVDAGIEQITTVENAVIEKTIKMNDNNNGDAGVSHSNNLIFHSVSGEVGDVKNLPEHKDLSQVYFKGRFDSHKGGKKGRSFSQSNSLFRTAFFPYSTRQHLGVPFQHKGTINSNMYLILEVKGKGKTHEAVDYVAVTLGELFAGNKYSSRWLQMDNGGSIHVTMTCKEIEIIPGSPGRTGRSRLSFRKRNASES